MLKKSYTNHLLEAGCDEAGRGCLAGPVFAAAVILPPGFKPKGLNDSKQLNQNKRAELRMYIESSALSWAVAKVDNKEIDEINILNASILAMQKAIRKLKKKPELLLIDGNRFKPIDNIPFHCVVKGDAKYQSIAAASILAKTHRDEYMIGLHNKHSEYNWLTNKGYPTVAHKKAISSYGITAFHRKSFNLNEQIKLNI